MSKVNLQNAILVAIASAYAQGRYGTPDDLKAAGAQVGAQGPDVAQALEELFDAGRVTEGPSETEFGLSQEALDYANALIAQAATPALAATPAPAPAASKGASKAPAKAASKAKAATATASPAPAAQTQTQTEDADGGSGFRMKYTQADKLTPAELAQRVEIGLAAAEANHEAGQTVVAELIMRTLARLQRRLAKAQKEGRIA